MAYAVEKEGRIQVYEVLPGAYHSSVANVIGGFDKLPDNELERHGFYPVEELVLTDTLFQRRGEMYFDSSSKVFKYNTLEKIQPEVDNLKIEKLSTLEKEKESLLQPTNSYVIEAFELEIPIPTEILDSRSNIRKKYKKIKSEIEALNTQRELLTYNKSLLI